MIFLLLLCVLGIFFRVVSLGNEFACEETDFVKPAEAIRDTLHPVFYHSEQQPMEVALWHPPMYIYLLAFTLKFFSGEAGARIINIVFSVLTSVLIYLFCANIMGGKKGTGIGLVSSAFFLINYYIFSSSVLIDIDILSMFFLFGFVYSVLRYYQNKRQFYFWSAVACLFAGISNRYPMAFLIYFGIGAYYFSNRDFKNERKNYLKIGAISFLIFLIAWGIYSVFAEPGNFFSFLTHNLQLGAEQVSGLKVYLGSFVLNISQFVRLFTFPATVLLLWSIFYFLKKDSHLTRILLIYVLGTLVAFLLLPRPAFGYPRYFATVFPGMSILIGSFIYLQLRSIKINRKIIWIAFAVFGVSLALLYLLGPQPTIYKSNGLIQATNLPDFLMNVFASVPVLFLFLFGKEHRKKILVIGLIALCLSYSLYFTIQTINYEPHIREVADYLKERTGEDEVIIVPKAIGYYSERKFYINEDTLPQIEFSFEAVIDYVKRSYQNPQMDDGFFWAEGIYSGIYPPEPSEEELEKINYVVKYNKIEGLEPEKKIGEFYIYRVDNDLISYRA